MEQTDQSLEPLAPPPRSLGIVCRLYANGRDARSGIIVSLAGERLLFCRRDVIGHASRWVPDRGEAVMFDRILDGRGLRAFRVRPINSRHRLPADGA